MQISLDTILQITGAFWLRKLHPEAGVERLLLDSRNLQTPKGGLFFAIVGEHHDGHAYLADAYKNGVRYFVVSRRIPVEVFPEADVLLVNNTLRALQQVAAWRRQQFSYPVVGITGSNGKTIVKEWLYQCLQADYDIVRSPKSYNSQVGVPLAVWQMEAQHHLALFEAGISQPGEMAHLAAVIRPDIGIFTNIGPAHSQGFPDVETKVGEKMRLFDTAHTLIFCADHPLVAEAAEAWQCDAEGRQLLSWSYGETPATLQFEVEDFSEQSVRVTVRTQHDSFTQLPGLQSSEVYAVFSIPFSDDASIENALHCYTLMYWLRIDPHTAAARIAGLEPVEMRLELKAGIQRSLLINDAYSNDLASLRIALQFADQHSRNRPLFVVLSDILQSGMPAEKLYENVADLLDGHGVVSLIGIGQEIASITPLLPDSIRFQHYLSTAEFIAHLPEYNWEGALILLKGARVFQFENIARRLEQKAHKTVLEVNFGALAHNLKVYASRLQPGVRMMIMVKAAGYGAGPGELARLLEFHKVDYLGVAYIDEGIELRQAGTHLPILVLNPEASGYDAMYRYQLEPEVYNLSGLESLAAFAGQDKTMGIHLKLDTGMHRLGFEEDDIPYVLEWLAAYPNLQVLSVFSHLSAGDNQQFDDFTHRQAAAFRRMYEQLAKGLGYRPIRHIVNTGGIVRFPEYHFDMVRLGIGIYGVDSAGIQDQLQVVNTLKATISQIKYIEAGETVGYNRNGPIHRSSRIATISIGYADGFLRLAGNGRYAVLVKGQKAPTVGNICMDMSMIDITDIPESDVQEGDEVIIFGEALPVQELAACLQTIPYEVFTNIAERVKRVYWQE